MQEKVKAQHLHSSRTNTYQKRDDITIDVIDYDVSKYHFVQRDDYMRDSHSKNINMGINNKGKKKKKKKKKRNKIVINEEQDLKSIGEIEIEIEPTQANS